MAIYHASKAYVLSFTEAIAEELEGTGVTATALCPGVVLTGWQEAAGVSDDEPILRSPGVTTAAFVAETGYQGMVQGKRVVVPGLINKIGVRSQHHRSMRVVLAVVEKLHRAG
jgi:short-subunit dehydrogenase